MRKIREVPRLYFAAALSIRAIARSLGTSPSTVGDYLRRAKVAGLSWPVPESVDDAGLERRLFPVPPSSRTERPLPDRSEVHRELRPKSVTLSLLWQAYKETHPEGLQYSLILRAVPGLGREARPGDASGATRRREAVRRLRRADGTGWSTARPAGCARRRSSWPCSGRRATPTPRQHGRRPSAWPSAYGGARLEAVAARALAIDSCSFRGGESILGHRFGRVGLTGTRRSRGRGCQRPRSCRRCWSSPAGPRPAAGGVDPGDGVGGRGRPRCRRAGA